MNKNEVFVKRIMWSNNTITKKSIIILWTDNTWEELNIKSDRYWVYVNGEVKMYKDILNLRYAVCKHMNKEETLEYIENQVKILESYEKL